MRNHIIASFFDFLCSSSKVTKISKISEIKEKYGENNHFSKGANDEIKNYITSSLDLKDEVDLKLLDNTFQEDIEKQLFVPSNIQTISDLIKHFEEKYQISGLRTSDRVVEVEYQV